MVERLFARVGGHPRDVDGLPQVQVFVLSFVDDGSGEAAVHAEGELLPHGQYLHLVQSAVGNDLVAEHCRHGVVSYVVRHPDPPPEELHGQVLVLASVEDDAVLLSRRELDGNIGRRLHVQRLHLDVGRVVNEAQARQVFAPLACNDPQLCRRLFHTLIARNGRRHSPE